MNDIAPFKPKRMTLESPGPSNDNTKEKGVRRRSADPLAPRGRRERTTMEGSRPAQRGNNGRHA